MGKSAPAAPPAPDYVGAAQAEGQSNMNMARYTTGANRVNQYTPWGSLTYSNNQTFDQASYDAALKDWQEKNSAIAGQGYWQEMYGGGDNGNVVGRTWIPTGNAAAAGTAPNRAEYMRDNWTQTEALDPKLQAALDQQLELQKQRSNVAGSMMGRVEDAYSKAFNPATLDSYLSGVGAVDQSSPGRAGEFSTSAGVDTNVADNMRGVRGQNQYLGRFGSGSTINTNAPQYNPANANKYAKAAFDGQMELLQPTLDRQETRLRNSLAIQGLNPGSEASDGALGEFNTGRTQQLNALANQAMLTGQQIAQDDYQSQLAGFREGNAAQGQLFGQDVTGFGANQTAVTNENAARAQAFAQALQAFQAGNSAQGQKFGQDQSTYSTGLQGLTTNAALQQAQNQAQAQAYAQALSNYGTNWQQEQTLRNMPLNEMNSLLTGQQVQNPQFQNYYMQNPIMGANLTGAVGQQGQWAMNDWMNQVQSTNAANSTTGGLAGAALMAMAMMSDERLKKNVKKVAETEGGSNIYVWDWKGKSFGPNIGVIAQEHPEAAFKTKSGYLAVDYSRIH